MRGPPNDQYADDLLAHAAWLQRLARRLVGPTALADDLVQDTWQAALSKPPRQGGSLRPWLRAVLENFVRLRARAEGRRRRRESATMWTHDALPSPEQLLARHESLTLLAQLVRTLDEPFRSTVLLCFSEGLAPAEIARRQGVPGGTVRWRLKRGLDQLRAALDARHGGDRRAWSVTFAAFSAGTPAPGLLAGAIKGGLWIMKAKTRTTAAIAGLVLLLAGAAMVWRWDHDGAARSVGGAAPLSGPRLRAAGDRLWTARPGSIGGRVLDPRDRPVSGALVAAIPEPLAARRQGQPPAPPRMAASGLDGSYRMADLPPGLYRVTAAATGFVPVARAAVLVAGDRLEAVDLALAEGGHLLSGRVLDAGGGAIAGARLGVALDWRYDAESLQTMPLTTTDAAGHYRAMLPHGPHAFVVEADGYAPARAMVELVGAQTRDFRLNAASTLSGRVVLQGSQVAVAGALVRLECTWLGKLSTFETESAADGAFTFEGLEPGSCSLFAAKDGRAARIAGGLITEVASHVNGLLVQLEPARAIEGHVRGRAGAPAAGVHVRLTEVGGFEPDGPRWRAEAVTGADGAFRLAGVLPGSYRAGPLGRGLTSVGRLVTVGDRDVTGVVLEVEQASALKGIVTDQGGKPAAGAVVMGYVGTPGKLSRDRRAGPTRTGPDGRFRLEDAGPGDIDVSVDHATLGQIMDSALNLGPGEEREVTLRLGRTGGARIRGRVRWDDGRPAAGLPVSANAWMGWGARTSSAEDGTFDLGPFARGKTVTLQVDHMPWGTGERPTTTRTIKMENDADVEGVELTVPAADGTIRGVVLGPDDRPLSGATVETRPGRADSGVLTGNEGTFALEALPRGTYTVHAAHPGHPAAEVPGVKTGGAPTIVRVQAAARIAGVARRADGTSAAPYAIWAAPSGYRPPRIGQPNAGPARQWVSAREGAFSLGPLAPGAYALFAVSPDGQVGHVPGLTLSPGGQRLDVVVTMHGGAAVKGQVVDVLAGRPVAGATIRAAAFGRIVEAVADAEGRFALQGLVPGAAASLQVEGEGYVPLGRTVVVPPDARLTDLGSVFLVAEQRGRKTEQKGRLGLVVTQDETDRVVVKVAPEGMPGASAGLRPGDILLTVDGLDVTVLGLGGVTTLLRGEPGAPVAIRYESADGAVREVRVVRM